MKIIELAKNRRQCSETRKNFTIPVFNTRNTDVRRNNRNEGKYLVIVINCDERRVKTKDKKEKLKNSIVYSNKSPFRIDEKKNNKKIQVTL